MVKELVSELPDPIHGAYFAVTGFFPDSTVIVRDQKLGSLVAQELAGALLTACCRLDQWYAARSDTLASLMSNLDKLDAHYEEALEDLAGRGFVQLFQFEGWLHVYPTALFRARASRWSLGRGVGLSLMHPLRGEPSTLRFVPLLGDGPLVGEKN